MKRGLACLLLAVCCPLMLSGRGTQRLAEKTAAAIAEIMADRFNPRLSVISFENHTELSDIVIQNFYQILVSRLESSPQKNFDFSDRMVAFANGKGRFNSRRLDEIGFLVALKMLRSGPHVGVGITVFSRLSDRLAAVRYVSESIPPEELRVLDLPEPAFASAGFSMTARLEADSGLMDVCSQTEPNGNMRHYFLFPDKVDVFEWGARRMVRLMTLPLEWPRPFAPARHVEGHLLVFHNPAGTWLIAGANVAEKSLVFLRREGNWEAQPALDFVPIRHLLINDVPYLAGVRYAAGRNYFRGGLVLMPFRQGFPDPERLYEKPLPEAFAVDFTAREGRLTGLHMVDREYRYRLFTTDFEDSIVNERLRGAALAALDTDWVALSDYSRGKDRAFFFKTSDGGTREVYAADFPLREIRFISPGSWENEPGFWVCLENAGPDRSVTQLEFWRKQSVPVPEAVAPAPQPEEMIDVQD